MAATSTDAVPALRDRLPDGRPRRILALLGELAGSASADGAEDVHPDEVVVGPDGRIRLATGTARRPPPCPAPELAETGPTPASFVYSVGATAALVALGPLPPPPADPVAHQQWLEDVLARLLERWGETSDAQHALEWVERCLAHDRFARPAPNELVEALAPESPERRAPSSSSSLTFAGVAPSPPPRAGEAWGALAIAAAGAVIALFATLCAFGATIGRWLAP